MSSTTYQLSDLISEQLQSELLSMIRKIQNCNNDNLVIQLDKKLAYIEILDFIKFIHTNNNQDKNKTMQIIIPRREFY